MSGTSPSHPVRAWRETVKIPTYGIGAPDRNPMFLEKRVYQGSSGAVYPLPVIDHIADERTEQAWDAVFLENEYLKIMILPQLGGRVQMALDKTNDYHFVYYNRVIKPALVGLAGPWISGGIEFNWPQHHRPSTFMPVDCLIEEHADGARTAWCSEIDRMHRTKGMHGFRLYPDQALLEINVKLYNRTDLPQTFLWWANPAIHVDEHHQSIFPPDVHAVMDHGKRDVSSFPIATGEYYKVDYSPGTDISRYRNIPVPTSYMAYHSDYNFVGSYDHGKQAGLLHVANHHLSPGKKQWTWGNGDFGQRWDRHLTDADGPYIELMCGVYTDNQPDFSWLMPGEEKAFTQVFMPYKGVGVVKNATREAAIGLDIENGKATVKLYASRPFTDARLEINACKSAVSADCKQETLLKQHFDIDPRSCFEAAVELPNHIEASSLGAYMADAAGRVVVACRAKEQTRSDIPDPAQPIAPPEELDSTESLFQAGMHLEQYRHATREPEAYYREGLRRDAGDIRCNSALGQLMLRRGQFAPAEQYLRTAVQRQLRHNPNPIDGEALYHLGLSLEYQDRLTEACDAYWKATWNAACQERAYFALARLSEAEEAIELVDRCLQRNTAHHRAVHLKVFWLFQLARTDEAKAIAQAELAADPFNVGVLFELALQSGDYAVFDERMRDDAQSYLELASDYMACGAELIAEAVLERYLTRCNHAPATPMVYYYLADLRARIVGDDQHKEYDRLAAAHAGHLCFPNRLEEIGILQRASERNPHDARAPYYLGNLWYDKRQYDEAIACWEQAAALNPSFATPHRNLGLAYFNKRGAGERAWQAYSRAFECDPTDARVLFELDQLAKRLGHAATQRLERLSQYRNLVNLRDDLYLEYVTLLNELGRHQQAYDALLEHVFHPWEGGEGKVAAQYVHVLTELARASLDTGQYDAALTLLDRTITWPDSLGEGKLAGIQENNINYLRGLAYTGMGDAATARSVFEAAATGLSEPTAAIYYNDQPPDMIYYQGLALKMLGRDNEAQSRFNKLMAYGQSHLNDAQTIDYFAVSLPTFLVFEDDLDQRHQAHCYYMMALGQLGSGDDNAARETLERVLSIDRNHLGALTHLAVTRAAMAVGAKQDVKTGV